ncbi:MAG: hypothetical protein ACP5OU_05585 [Methanothrix sp.]
MILILLATGLSWATQWDFNPDQVAVKYKNDVTSDVTGEGYFKEYKKVNTNNLSMLEYAHGSGNLDFADILSSEQKSSSTSTVYYIGDRKVYFDPQDTKNFTMLEGDWTSGKYGPSSVVTYTRQYDNIQSPTAFGYGTGWYAANPIGFNSLLKDKNEAKSYQEGASMHRQVEYAHALKGDIAVDINCTAPTATEDGKGTLSMKIDDDVTQGALHIGELLNDPKVFNWKIGKATTYGHKAALKDPIILVDNDYIGNFQVQTAMKMEISKSKPTWREDWLPCCHGGFFDILSYNFDKERGGQKGIFDCTCRNTSISTMKPKWNASLAQFPTDKYRYQP